MANRKLKAPPTDSVELLPMTPETRALVASEATIATTHIDTIERLYGDGLEFVEARSVARYQAHKSAGTHLMLLAGAELIRIKEHTERGRFLYLLHGELDTEPRAAQKMMQAAAKFLTADGIARPLLTGMDAASSKLFELMLLDDDDLDAIEQGERVAGINKDDIANMSVSELRKAVRVARETEAADKQLIDQVYDSKNKLQRDLDKANRGGIKFEEHAYLATIKEARAIAENALIGFVSSLALLQDAQNQLDAIEVPAHLDDTAKRAPVMTLNASTLQIAESLARVIWEQEALFGKYLNDAPRTLAALDGHGTAG